MVYRCVKRSVVRSGVEGDSEKAGLLAVGETVTVLEEAVNAEGGRRVRFDRGWTSVEAANGAVALELVSGGSVTAAAAAAVSPPAVPVPVPSEPEQEPDPPPPPSLGEMVSKVDVSRLLSSDDESEESAEVLAPPAIPAPAASAKSVPEPDDPAPPPSLGELVGTVDVSKLLGSDDEEAEPEPVPAPALEPDPAPPLSLGDLVGKVDATKLLSSDDDTDDNDEQAEAEEVAAAASAEAAAADAAAAAAAASAVAAAMAAAAAAAVVEASAAAQAAAAEAAEAEAAEAAAAEVKLKADAAAKSAVVSAAADAAEATRQLELATAAAAGATVAQTEAVDDDNDDGDDDDETEREWLARIEDLTSQGWIEPPVDFDELDDLIGAQLYLKDCGLATLLTAKRKRKGWGPCTLELDGTVAKKRLVLRACGKEHGRPFLYMFEASDDEDHVQEALVQWRALQPGVIRASVERTSDKMGNLEVNEVFDQLERFVTEDGIVRVRCRKGWVSVTASDGFPLCVREDSIQQVLTSVPLLQSLDDAEREEIAKALGYEAYAYDEAIVEQGDDGDHMYFLEEGQAQADVDGTVVMTYAVGDYFGELSLLGNSPRKATVTATGPAGARCLVLGRESFELIAAKNAKTLATQRRQYHAPTKKPANAAVDAPAGSLELALATVAAAVVAVPKARAAPTPAEAPVVTPRTQLTVDEHMQLAEKLYTSDCEADKQRALQHFKVAASLGDTIGRRSLGVMYEHGEGGPVNLALALHYYQLAAASGDVQSDNSAGEILLSEVVANGVDAAAEQFEEAMMHFQRAAERANTEAMYNLAEMIIYCLDGCGTAAAEAAAESAVNLLSQAAESGHSAAERELGTCLFHGVGVDRDLAAAVAHYRSASAAGDAAATYTLGWRYYKGEGTLRSLPEAERCFMAASARGHVEAAKAVAHAVELRQVFEEQSVRSPRAAAAAASGSSEWALGEFALSRGIAAAAEAASPTGWSEDWRLQAARPRAKEY